MFNKNKCAQYTYQHRRDKGQGLTEYALILSLVAVAVILIVNVMEPVIANVFSNLANDAPVAPPALLAFTPPPTGEPVTLTVNIDPAGGGSVVADPDKTEYGPGETVALEAVPTNSNWVFIGWEGDLIGTNNPASLTMNGDRTVTAKFAELIHTLTLNESGSGTASSTPPETDLFGVGQEVEIEAAPGAGWIFDRWQGDYTGTDNPATITITGDMVITAVFADTARTLTTNIISDPDTGTGGTIQANPPNTGPYPDGTEITLTAVANPGWYFAGWSGNLSGDGNPKIFAINSDMNVTAVFIEAPATEYTLTALPSGSGAVTKDPDQTSYTAGANVTLTATADPGHAFTGWSGDLAGSQNPVTITMDSNKSITANFEAEAYTLTITEVGNGTTGKNPDQPTYSYNDIVNLTAVADPGWTFDGWSGDLTSTATSIPITMDASKTITATFTEVPCSLNSPWQSTDIGSVPAAGKACENAGTFTVYGSGADIFGTSDEFHFMYQTLDSDGEIVARITSQTDTDAWAKAGVMIRESLGANASYAFAALTPSNGVNFQARSATGANATGISSIGNTAPTWIKVARVGDTFTASYSSDGVAWAQFGTTTVSMGATAYFGLGVTSHAAGLSTAVFTDVAINSLVTPFQMETVVRNDVSSANWAAVSLTNTYIDPIVVCSLNYRNNTVPEVVRMRNVTATGFQIQLQNPNGNALIAEPVHCLVVEAGAWDLPDGTKIEAQRYNSTVTSENNNWVGETRSYLQGYSNPVVLGQVMTTNDADWSVFWNRGSTRRTPPDNANLQMGKHVGQDGDTTRANETIGFIVIESGNGTFNGVSYEADLGADIVKGVTNAPPYNYTFNNAFSAAPQVILVTQAAMDGGDGSWAYFYGAVPATTNSLQLVVDEYSGRSHTTEQIGYLVFSQGFSYP